MNNKLAIITEPTKQSTLSVFGFSLIVFLYIFNIRFIAFQWMPTGRLIFLALTMMCGIGTYYYFKKELRKHPFYFLTLGFIISYIVLQAFVAQTSDFGMLSRITVFTVFTLYMAGAFAQYFPSIRTFILALGIACFFQSVMVFISFFSVDYRGWLGTVLVESGNIPFSFGSRVPGFTNGSGSSLSVTLSLGIFANMVMYYFSTKSLKKNLYLFMAFFILASCIFVGKLGLFLGLYFIFALFFLEFINKPTSLIKFAILVPICVLGILQLEGVDSLVYPIQRSFSFFLGKEETVSTLQNMPIPPLGVDTIIGYGQLSKANGSNAAGSDIGYIQSYYGFGLIFSLIFYISLLFYLLVNIASIKIKVFRLITIVLFLPLFIIELKEPFITKVTYPFVLFCMVFLAKKTEKLVGIHSK